MNKEKEHAGYVVVGEIRHPVTCLYEIDGYKPIGLYVVDDDGVDITFVVPEAEYDRLYGEVCQLVAADIKEQRND